MRGSAVVPTSVLVLAALTLGGCEVTIGEDDEPTTVTEPAQTVTERTVTGASGGETEEAEPPPEPTGPTGALGTEGVGEATVGTPQSEVEALFGPPDRTETVNLGGGSSAPQSDWIWEYDDGEVRLQFETDGDTLTGYRTDSSQLATSSGVSVGDSFAPIQEEYGDQLEEPPIGEGLFLLSEGDPGSYPGLTFEVDRSGVVRSISGGVPQAAGE